MTEKEFNEYIIGDHMPTKYSLPNGCVCFENIHIFWFKTSEKLPDGYEMDSENSVFCYGAYLQEDGTYYIQENLRYNTDTKNWEWLFEAGYDYWESCETPDYWAYQELPMGPSI